MVSQRIPEPVDNDGEDVRWALATAKRLSATGEHEAAARWVRRAVSAALDEEHVERAAILDRAAQLLENEVHSEEVSVPSTERDHSVEIKPPTPPARELAPTLQDITTNPTTEASPDARKPRFDFDDEATVVSTPHDVLMAAESTMKLQAVPPMPGPPAAARSEGAPSTDHEPTVVSRPAVRDTLEELRIPDSLRDEMPAVSSDTMTSFARFRVALLASSDDEHPRIIALGTDEKPPSGAGVGFLVADSEEDREAIAILLGLQKP